MIIFLKGPLHTLNYFIDCMTEGVENACVLDFVDEDWYQQLANWDADIDEMTDVITFNNVGIAVSIDGSNYWELKKVRLHNIYVDHPLVYTKELALALKCMQIITIDKYHKQFINTYFPNYESVHFLPHGGMCLADAEEIPYENRQIDVLYVGTRKRPRQSSLEEQEQWLYDMVRNLLVKYPYLTLEKIYDLLMEDCGVKLERDETLALLNDLYYEVLRDVRFYYMGKVIEVLAEAGIHIEIYGDGWTEFSDYEHVHVHELIEPEECIRLMHNSKITLNILPWFKYGAHERIYNAMLNGSVCVSDTSEYLTKYFENGKNIVFYEMNKLDELVKNVKMLLENPEFAKHIIENQKKTVIKSTWNDRLHNILEERFEEGKDFI